MSGRRIDFEPEIVFPDNPFDAARVYLGATAYPERGAGQPGGLGVGFSEAMWNYVVWNGRQAKGLRYVREKFGDPAFQPPAKRDFEGALNRGWRRLRRRSAAYSLVGTQMLNGFFGAGREAQKLAAEGREAEVYQLPIGAKVNPFRPELWMRATPSARAIVSRDIDRWAAEFGLNTTGKAADDEQKAKDLVRRAWVQSRPVLHMAHGFNTIVTDIGPTLDGWDDWDWMLVLLWNPEAWVWEAIETAETWRQLSRFHFTPELAPEQMIALSASKIGEIMPPATGSPDGR